jgi:hypothetical protein
MEAYFQLIATCAVFANQLLRELQGFIPNLPSKCESIIACFRIPLVNGYALSVSVPSDKNRFLKLTDDYNEVTVETALFKDNKLIYDDELGYSDVLCHYGDANEILAEYTRLMHMLAERE